MAFRTSNPILNEKRFKSSHSNSHEVMTVEGTAQKTLLLLLILVATASSTWKAVFVQDFDLIAMYLQFVWPVIIATLVIAVVIVFKPHLAKWLSMIYAALEGFFIGLVSAIFELMYPGIVLQAVALTFGVALVMFFVQSNKLIKVDGKFRLAVMSATGAIALFYMIAWVTSMFGSVYFSNLLHGSSWLSIGISVVIVGVAALNLILDFDFIERAVKNRFDKKMEWYGAFGLIVTLIWLYLEILRLLGKINNRR